MNETLSNYPQRIDKRVIIEAAPETIWEHLTVPDLMKKWMGDEEMELEIRSEWKAGSSITIKGFHHVYFENKGTILQWEPGNIFEYEYLSSLSDLPEEAENYTRIAFTLIPKEKGTELLVKAENFPTFEIYKHLEFYWNGTLEIIKRRSREKSEN